MFRTLSSVLCLLTLMMQVGCHQGAGSAEVAEVQPDENGVYPSNPFTLPTEEPFPEIEVLETTFDFGRMAVNTEGSHPFVIRNIGEVPVRLARGPSTCQCTMGNLQVDTLEPGAETEVLLIWKPEVHELEFSKSAAIFTNVPEMQRLDFSVRGQVVPSVNIIPGPNWTAGMVKDDEPVVLEGMIYSLLDEGFEVHRIEASHDWLNVSYTPADTGTLEGMMGLSGYNITCEVLPSCPIGEFLGTLTVFTNQEQQFMDEIVINISGSRTGPFEITGRNWTTSGVGTIGELDMGTIAQPDGASFELSLIMTPMEQLLELTPIASDPEFLQFDMRLDENYPASAKQRYYLTFTVPPNSDLGDWTGENAGSITFRTNIPEREEVTISVVFKVENSN